MCNQDGLYAYNWLLQNKTYHVRARPKYSVGLLVLNSQIVMKYIYISQVEAVNLIARVSFLARQCRHVATSMHE